MNDNSFLRNLQTILKINIVAQLILYFCGLGRWYSQNRYMGSFNDPNQLAFFCMISFFVIFVIEFILQEQGLQKRMWVPWLVACTALISFSSSTGMLLGIVGFITLYFFLNTTKFGSIKQIIAVVVILCVIVVTYLILLNHISLPSWIEDNFAYQRMMSKIEKIFLTDIKSSIVAFVDDRNLDALIEYPDKIFYGMGEGMWYRIPVGSGGELHCTPLGILLYYGVIPWSFWVYWIVLKIKGLPHELYCVYFAFGIETFTLINHRQPLFWIAILLAGVSAKVSKNKLLLD